MQEELSNADWLVLERMINGLVAGFSKISGAGCLFVKKNENNFVDLNTPSVQLKKGTLQKLFRLKLIIKERDHFVLSKEGEKLILKYPIAER